MNQMNYPTTTRQQRLQFQQISAQQLNAYQLNRCNQLFAEILPANSFYAAKIGKSDFQIDSIEALAEIPFTFKHELLGDEPSTGFAANLTFPIDQYTRFHRTSGTRGRPLTVLDTHADWQWWMESWQYVLDSAELTSTDRAVLAFSFGPFIGFWSAFDAAVARQCLVVPTGGMTTLARLELIRSISATVVFCTPSYASHMAEVAADNHINIADSSVRAIIVAGEPGGSIPSVRGQIETQWRASVVDHCGASEVGPWGFADPLARGIYVNEAQFLAEFISMERGQPAADGELSELVLTTLGRAGSPVIRYRTGDLVRPTWSDDQSGNFVLLVGGVLGRTDDMMIVRGVNVFPTSIEQIVRSFPEVVEYRLTAYKESSMDQLKIEIEDRLQRPERVQQELQLRLGLRVDVTSVPLGSLPRFEAKGKRFIDNR
jgi:phenylacetate-CoA ligase